MSRFLPPPQAYWYFLGVMLLLACQPEKPAAVVEAGKSIPRIIDFNRHVKPILSDRCFACHGPDKNNQEADLRLDTEAGLFAALTEGNGHVIVPGNLRQSAVYQRIVASDPEVQMPPPESNLSLSPREIAILSRWIEQGAVWKPHWAFITPELPELPNVTQADWARNPIDHFVLAKLEGASLSPSPEADRETLIRRVSFDLTGLPPTLEEIDAFLADESPDAYERVVDRLLASPAYGERMATHWMDVARFADSYGYLDDKHRPMWPWRDWVIKSYNENLPYDDFITWQLAGDLLPNPTKEQVLATAFNRNHKQNSEAGIIYEEYRVEYVADRNQHAGQSLSGTLRRVRPLPRPQVRSDFSEGILPAVCLLQQHLRDWQPVLRHRPNPRPGPAAHRFGHRHADCRAEAGHRPARAAGGNAPPKGHSRHHRSPGAGRHRAAPASEPGGALPF